MNKKLKPWTDKEIEVLKQYYPKRGPKYVGGLLKRNPRAVAMKALYLNIKKIKNLPIDKIFLNEFYTIMKPEVAFFLGFFWADGHVSKTTNAVTFGLVRSDAEDIKFRILKILPFNTFITRPKERIHSQYTFVFHKQDKKLHDFLYENDYHIKSQNSPTKILKKIPKNLHYAWWQGYFNGDGCLYLNKTNGYIHPRISIVAPKNQNWEFYENLCNELQIRYKIYKQKNKFGEWSMIYIQNITECRKFLDYIYQYGNLGLKRKFDKYLILKKSVNIPHPKRSKFLGVSPKVTKKYWRAYCCYNKKTIYIGLYQTELEAAQKRDEYIIKNNLPCKLNFNQTD